MRGLIFIFFFVLELQAGYSELKPSDSVFLFAYFKNNGEDGLHFAGSPDGYTWKSLNGDQPFLTPAVGHDKLMRDPCIIKGGDGAYHMVWTVSWGEKGIGYASSADLIHWSTQQFIPVMEHEKTALNCWAPEVFYDEVSKKYMIYWATTIPGRFNAGDTSGDGKYNHRIYYVTTNDFKTFSKAAVLYDKGFNVIDATIQKNGTMYTLFLKNETLKPPEKNIRIATSNNLTGGYSEASAPITGAYWAEGPTVIKLNGKWFAYFDKYTEHAYGAVISTDLKEWKDISGEINFPQGVRHGTVLRVSAKEFEKLSAIKN
jgi:Glycosyl hydrolases family 43